MERQAALLFLALVIVSFTDAAAQQGGVVTDRPARGSEEISEYYNVNDVRNAMIIIAIAVGGVLAYLAREIILRKKTDYEKKDYASKHDRDFEKYHSEWNSDEEEFIGRKKSKESEEFRKMLQESSLPDYYATLGVASDATPREIKSRFRQLVKQYHPDKTKDETTAEKLAEINKAYEVLSDSEKRRTYDAYFKASR